MCVNCGSSSCSSCNKTSFIPAWTSALKYDGPNFVCSSKGGYSFSINTCTTLNDTLTEVFKAICHKNAASVLREEIISISSAEIKALNTTPILLLSNSVTHGYDIHSVVIIAQQVGVTDYTYTIPAAPTQLVVKAISAIYPSPGQSLFSTGVFLEGLNAMFTAGITQPGTKMLALDAGLTANDNTGIYLTTGGIGESYLAGEHTISVIVTYKEVTL
jgi:hypothetical protein